MSNYIYSCKQISLFYFLYYISVFFLNFLPSIKINSNFYSSVYSQINYNSSHLDLTKFFIYILTILLGFILFNKKYFKVERHNPLKGPNNSYKEIILIFIISVIFYFSSGITTLIGKYDYENLCHEEGKQNLENHKRDGVLGYAVYKSMMDFKRIYSFTFLENFFNFFPILGNNKKCIYPGMFERINTNFFCFFLPFYFGLHLNYLSSKIFSGTNFRHYKKWNKKTSTVFIILSLLLLLQLIFSLFNYFRNSFLKVAFYLSLIILIIGIILFCKNKLKKEKILNLQISHFVIITIPFVNIHCLYNLILLGLLNGILVSEICLDGFINFFEHKDKFLSEINLITPSNENNDSIPVDNEK